METLEDLPLRCHIDHGVIHIEIGHNILAFASKYHPDFEHGTEIIDAQMFGLEVVQKINEEAEDGSTMLTRMLDHAILRAIEDGAEGVKVKGE